MKKWIFVLAFLPQLLFAGAKGDSIEIMATNSWTAAFVEAATGETCPYLAPSDMSHPPEYELKPGDFEKLTRTEHFVYAGYEVMMKEISSSAEIPEDALVSIQTGYSRGVLAGSIGAIGVLMGTQDIAVESIASLLEILDTGKEDLAAAGEVNVVVNFHQKALAEEMGFNVLTVFGPAPLQPGDLERIAALENVDFILDNAHNPMGEVLKEFHPDAAYASGINFPGIDGTTTLKEVLQRNIDLLKETLL